MNIAEKLSSYRERLSQLDADHVKILAVTKGFGSDAVLAAQAAGLNAVGENYAQEAKAKHEELAAANAPQPQWHFIGQLQSNKVKALAGFINVWQTVDSPSLVKEIAKRAPGANVMIQVNLSEEAGRGGCSWDEAAPLVELARAEGLQVGGLMAVGLHGPPEDSRPAFRRLAAVASDLEVQELSMGMSGDFEVAVQEGATMIRLGTALFGDRPPRKEGRDPADTKSSPLR